MDRDNPSYVRGGVGVRAIRYLTERLNVSHTLRSISSALGTNRNTLCKEFKVETGTSVKQWLNEMRLQKAAHLLYSTNLSIIEISFEVGYQDPANFATAFKKYHKCTPRKYRKSRLKITRG